METGKELVSGPVGPRWLGETKDRDFFPRRETMGGVDLREARGLGIVKKRMSIDR